MQSRQQIERRTLRRPRCPQRIASAPRRRRILTHPSRAPRPSKALRAELPPGLRGSGRGAKQQSAARQRESRRRDASAAARGTSRRPSGKTACHPGGSSVAQALQRLNACSWAAPDGSRAHRPAKSQTRFAGNRQARHRHAVLKAGSRSMRLQRLRADRRKQHRVQAKRVAGRARHRQMAQMGRIEAAAEECDAPACSAASWLMDSCVSRPAQMHRLRSLSRAMRYFIVILALAGVRGFRAGSSGSLLHRDRALLHQREVGLRHREPQLLCRSRPRSRGRHRHRRLPGPGLACAGAAARAHRWSARVGRACVCALSQPHRAGCSEVWCLYCVISQGIIALLTLLSVGWLVAGWVANAQDQT